ncbi:MAG: hypothetical protein ABEJ04_00320 [Halobacteriaceae archaeon]
MVEDTLSDGKRIAQLLASELDGRADGALSELTVVGARPDAEPSTDGTFAYAVARGDERVAAVYLHPERARVDVLVAPAAAADAAADAGLRHRPRAGTPPALVAFVEDGGEVKRAAGVVAAATAATDPDADAGE